MGAVQLFVPARSLMADPLATVVEGVVAGALERRVPVTLTGLSADEVAHFGAAAFAELVTAVQPDTVIFTRRDHARLGLGTDRPIEGSGCTIVMGPERTAVITAEGSHYREPSLPATVVDRTGATDGFVAGYLMSRRAGAAPVAAVDAAHRGDVAGAGQGGSHHPRRTVRGLARSDCEVGLAPCESRPVDRSGFPAGDRGRSRPGRSPAGRGVRGREPQRRLPQRPHHRRGGLHVPGGARPRGGRSGGRGGWTG